MPWIGVTAILMCCVQLCGVKGLQVEGNDDLVFELNADILTQLESPQYDEELGSEFTPNDIYQDFAKTEGLRQNTDTEQFGYHWKTLKNRIAGHRNHGEIPLSILQTDGLNPSQLSSRLAYLKTVVKILQEIAVRSSQLSTNNPDVLIDKELMTGQSMTDKKSVTDSTTGRVVKAMYKKFVESYYPKTKQHIRGLANTETQKSSLKQVLQSLNDIMDPVAVKNDESSTKVQGIYPQSFKDEMSEFNSQKRGMQGDYSGVVGDNGESTQKEELLIDKEIPFMYESDNSSDGNNDYNNKDDTLLNEKQLSNRSGIILNDKFSQIATDTTQVDSNSTMFDNLPFSGHLAMDDNGHMHNMESNHSSNSGDNTTQGAKSLELESRSPETTPASTTQNSAYYIDDLVDDTQTIEFYRDICQSRNGFEMISTAINDHLENVEVLPNTWVWSSKCVTPSQPCSSIGPGIKALCKQKKGWVQAFARLHSRDPWRWHWIAVDSGCSCGVKIGR